jgi:ABC-type multidrug transport system fused ATPase/permease subunit
VEVEGFDIWGDVEAWRSRTGWVPQEPHLFPGTIADNLRFAAPAATDMEIRESLDRAAASFVFSLPQGIDSEIGERASLLSAGERARIAIARALIRRPDLLVLDEPTAHLDTLTEQRVLDTLEGIRGRASVVMAAHRPAAAARADRIVALERGRIGEAPA